MAEKQLKVYWINFGTPYERRYKRMRDGLTYDWRNPDGVCEVLATDARRMAETAPRAFTLDEVAAKKAKKAFEDFETKRLAAQVAKEELEAIVAGEEGAKKPRAKRKSKSRKPDVAPNPAPATEVDESVL